MSGAMRLGVQAALVDGQLLRGDVSIEDGRVAEVGSAPAAGGGLAVPGFIDLQINGFAGVDFLTAQPDGYRAAGEALVRTGVTAYRPTFVSSPLEAYAPALRTVGELKPEGARILGVHLEGPFLSPEWPGAHNPGNLLAPDTRTAEDLCRAGPVTAMTLAPELPGGLELVSWLIERGILVSVGHSDADAAAAHAAFDRGARAVTHLFNGHRRFGPRDPGIAGAALSRPEVTVTAIVDNVHLAPDTVRMAFLAARGRFALITDAVEAAGLRAGTYRLGDRVVHADGDSVRLDDGTLAGSALTMDLAVRNLAGMGIPLPQVLEAATAVPARLADRPDLGILRPGAPADVVVLDDSLEVRRTLIGGREAFSA